MDEERKLIKTKTVLEIVNKILDYADQLTDLTNSSLDDSDISSAREYFYATKVLKTIVEEIIKEYE